MKTLLPIVFLSVFMMGCNEGKELLKQLETIFYWVALIGALIAGGTIIAARLWPDSFVEPLARQYSKHLSYAILAFLAFGIFKGPIAKFFVWLANPLKDVFDKMAG